MLVRVQPCPFMRTKPRTFFVNGHTCEVEYVSREHYHGYIDGEKVSSAREPGVRKELRTDAKYRPATEPDRFAVAEAIYSFLRRVDEWVLFDDIIDSVFPEGEVAYMSVAALRDLERLGLAEQTEATVHGETRDMWRPTDPTDLWW